MLTEEKTVELFEKFGVFTRAELESRAEIQYEAYSKAINIEARSMIDIASKHIIPSVLPVHHRPGTPPSTRSVPPAPQADISVQIELSGGLLDPCWRLQRHALKALTEVTEKAAATTEGRERAVYILENVVPAMAALRQPVDKLEMLVAKDMWPMPSYGDLLFEV